MIRLLSLLFCITLIAFTTPKLNSQEVCESYTYFGYLQVEQNCPVYCCGSCSNRYCCRDINDRLPQNQCYHENCEPYYISYDGYINGQTCPELSFCCGSCDIRYCCKYPSSRLNQSSCSTERPPKTTTSYPKTTSSFMIFWISFGACLLILIVLIILAGLNNKRKAIIREYNMRSLAENIQANANNTSVNNINHQSNTRSNFVIADNSAYNHDLPPSYETIVVSEKKTNESNL